MVKPEVCNLEINVLSFQEMTLFGSEDSLTPRWENAHSQRHQALGKLFTPVIFVGRSFKQKTTCSGERKENITVTSHNPSVFVRPYVFQVLAGIYLIHEKLFLKCKNRFHLFTLIMCYL